MIEPSAKVGFGDDRGELLSKFHPYRLWSLWELMKPFSAWDLGFVHAIGDRNRFPLDLPGTRSLDAFRKIMTGNRGPALDAFRGVIENRWKELFYDVFCEAGRFCEYHQFSASLATVKKLIECLGES